MEHKIPLETYFAGLLQKVEWQIQEYEDTAADTLTLCRLCVDYLQEILGELKTFIISYPFASTEEEIHFFKELKPLLASKIIYYNTVYKIEVRFPSGSEDVQRDYLLSETDRISKSFQRNLAFYQYHRTKATYLDRYNPQIQISAESETKRSIFREKDKTKRSKKESAQHSKSRNKSFVMTSVSAL